MFVQERLCCVCLFCVVPPLTVFGWCESKNPSTPVLLQALSILLDYSCASLLFRFPLTPRGAALSFMKWGSGRGGVRDVHVALRALNYRFSFTEKGRGGGGMSAGNTK